MPDVIRVDLDYKPHIAPPEYNDDMFPANRQDDDPFFLRIGDCKFSVPPEYIEVNHRATIKSILNLRQKQSMKTKSGYRNIEILVTLWFNDIEAINGTIMDGPGGDVYYMDGLRTLIAQFKRAPFLPITNEYLNGVHQVWNVTLNSLNVSTVPEFPGCVRATLRMQPFNHMPYTQMPAEWAFHDMIAWPLYRWYYQQMISVSGASSTRLAKISNKDLTGSFTFKTINPQHIIDKNREKLTSDLLEVSLSDETVVTSLSFHLTNSLNNIQIQSQPIPTHQYLGSMDTEIVINMTSYSREDVATLRDMMDVTEMTAREYRDRFAAGFLKFENELCQLFGVNFVMVRHFNVKTVTGFPDLFEIEISLVSFDILQGSQESLKDGYNPFIDDEGKYEDLINETVPDDMNGMVHEAVIERKLNAIELYPDLELPSYEKVNKVITKINEFRTQNKLKPLGITELKNPGSPLSRYIKGAVYVDPDFYIFYPKPGDIKVSTAEQKLQLTTVNKVKSPTPSSPAAAVNNTANRELCRQIGTVLGDAALGDKIYNLWPYFTAASQETGLPIELIMGLAMQESTFNQSAGSGAGARGIMQLLPTTALAVGVNINDAQENILGGAIYLKGHIDDFNGDLTLGLAAYNAGAGNVHKYNGVPPFPETQNYVRQVPSYRDQIRSVIDGNPITSIMSNDVGQNVINQDYTTDEEDVKGFNQHGVAVGYPVDISRSADIILKDFSNDRKQVTGDELTQRMYHDAVLYDRRGTMLRAFPTFLFLIIDEGQMVDGRKLWDNYYCYHSINSISVHKTRKQPASTAHLTLSNVYGNLTTENKLVRPTEKNFWSKIEQYFFPDVTQRMLDERTDLKDHMSVQAGARVHIRMGYGSNVSLLPISFNGRITEITTGDIIEIICQGDGLELANLIIDVDNDAVNTAFRLGTEPKNIIDSILSERSSSFQYRQWGKANRFGIEHFGFAFRKDEDGFVNAIQNMALSWVGIDAIYNYDLVKNVYPADCNGDCTVMDNRTGWLKNLIEGVNEAELQMYLYGRPVWDVFQTLAQASPDYICAVQEHGFHSTLFFGMPWWEVRYRHIPIAEEIKNEPYNFFDAVKPFQQVHILSSSFDIINNDIQATEQGLITACKGNYNQDGTSGSAGVVFADLTIFPEYQRTGVVDTTTIQDLPIPTATLSEWFGTIFNVQPGKIIARRIAIGTVANSFRDMYQGELLILGDGSIKPHDVISISDNYTQMFGCCEVKEVVNTISLETGFVTTITPDLCVTSYTPDQGMARDRGQVWKYGMRGAVIGLSITRMYLKGLNLNRAKGLITLSGRLGNVLSKVKILQKAGTWFKTALAAEATVTTTGVGTVPGLISIGLTLTAWYIWGKVTDIIVEFFSDENVIKIWPLWYKDKPFVAGIKGHSKLIPGYVNPDNSDGKLPSEIATGASEGIAALPGKAIEGAKQMAKATSGKYRWPIKNVSVSCNYGKPGSWSKGYHTGTDLTGSVGDTISVVKDGIVITAGDGGAYGNYVIVDHYDGIKTLYAHMSKITVSKGKMLSAGDKVGEMGYSGRCIPEGVGGTHLHFEIRKDDQDVDPASYMQAI